MLHYSLVFNFSEMNFGLGSKYFRVCLHLISISMFSKRVLNSAPLPDAFSGLSPQSFGCRLNCFLFSLSNRYGCGQFRRSVEADYRNPFSPFQALQRMFLRPIASNVSPFFTSSKSLPSLDFLSFIRFSVFTADLISLRPMKMESRNDCFYGYHNGMIYFE